MSVIQITDPNFLLVLYPIIIFAGLQIVFNLDEVSFIQNLVFYIESAYCIPVSLNF